VAIRLQEAVDDDTVVELDAAVVQEGRVGRHADANGHHVTGKDATRFRHHLGDVALAAKGDSRIIEHDLNAAVGIMPVDAVGDLG